MTSRICIGCGNPLDHDGPDHLCGKCCDESVLTRECEECHREFPAESRDDALCDWCCSQAQSLHDAREEHDFTTQRAFNT